MFQEKAHCMKFISQELIHCIYDCMFNKVELFSQDQSLECYSKKSLNKTP